MDENVHRDYRLVISIGLRAEMPPKSVEEAFGKAVFEHMSEMIRTWKILVMPEPGGLVLVDRRRHEVFERLLRAHKRKREATRDLRTARTRSAYLNAGHAWLRADKDVEAAVDELEAMERETPAR